MKISTPWNSLLLLFIVLLIPCLVIYPFFAQAQKPIKIGMINDFTSAYAAMGQQMKWAMEMAIEEINGKGGVLGRKLEVITEDDQNNPAVSSSKAEKLILQDGVDFLFSSTASHCTLANMKVAEKYKKVMIAHVSESAKITGEECSRYTFRIAANMAIEANTLIDWVLKNMGKNIYLISADYAFGRSASEEYRKVIDRLGGKVIGESFFPLNNKDFAPYFGKIKAAKPDVLLITAAGNDAIAVVAQLNQFGLMKLMRIAGVGSLTASDVLPAHGSNADGIITADRYSSEIPSPENKAFVEKYKKHYKEVPSKFVTGTYEAIHWLVQAIEKAKSVDADAVIKALEDSVYNGPQGPKKMRAGDHQAIMNMYILRCEGGKHVIVDYRKGEEVIHLNMCNKW